VHKETFQELLPRTLLYLIAQLTMGSAETQPYDCACSADRGGPVCLFAVGFW